MKNVVQSFVFVILIMMMMLCVAEHEMMGDTRSLAEEADTDAEESDVICWLFPPQGDGFAAFISLLLLLPVYVATTPVCWPSLALYYLGLTEGSDPVCRFFLGGCIDF